MARWAFFVINSIALKPLFATSVTCCNMEFRHSLLVEVFNANQLMMWRRGGERVYYHGPHELCIIAGGCKINWFYPKVLPFSNYEEEWLLLTYYLSTCLSWIFVLTRCCTLTWVYNENCVAGHIKCSRGPQVPHPWCNVMFRYVGYRTHHTCPYINASANWRSSLWAFLICCRSVQRRSVTLLSMRTSHLADALLFLSLPWRRPCHSFLKRRWRRRTAISYGQKSFISNRRGLWQVRNAICIFRS